MAKPFALASALNSGDDSLSGNMVNFFVWKFLPRVSPAASRWRIARVRPFLFLPILVLLATILNLEAAPQMTFSLDRNTISLGDSTVLTMSFSDCSPAGTPQLPPIANLEYGSRGSQQSFSVVGPSVTRKTDYTIELKPMIAGTYNIPAMAMELDGAHLQSQPLTLTVLRGEVPPPAGEPATAVVKILPSTNQMYVGQVLPVEVQCYCRDNVGSSIQMPQFTSDSFIISDLTSPRQRSNRVQLNGMEYNLFTFHGSASAIKAGVYKLGPATWTLTVFTGQHTFFGWSESHQATFTSDTPEIQVRAVPVRGAPAGFAGAVGEFNLAEYEAGPTDVGVGDPITLKIRIAGRGAWDTVMLPTNNNNAAWQEFKTYPASAKTELLNSTQTTGSKYFEQVITPQNAEVKEVPPFVFSFFNPQTSDFQTISHPGIPVAVHATAATPQPAGTVAALNADSNEPKEDIVHIKPVLGPLRRPTVPLVERPEFLIWQTLPPLALVCAVIRRKRKEKISQNPRLRRRREVARRVRDGLDELPALAAAANTEKFYSTVLRLLQEQLGERLDLPAAGLTEAVLETLPAEGLQAETPALLRELFMACNQYHYAPEHAAREMASLIPKVKTALRDLADAPLESRKSNVAAGLGVIFFMLSATGLLAGPADDFFSQGNKMYEQGKYADAAISYGKILHAGEVSPALYFNLGNAYLKTGQNGRAIYALSQAAALAPRDSDIRANLQIARERAGASARLRPVQRLTQWAGRLSLNEWTLAAAAAVACFFLLLTGRVLFPAWKDSGRLGPILLGLVAGFTLLGLGLAVARGFYEKSVVVVAAEAVARRGPLVESQSVFTAHDGAELVVLDRHGDWLEVADAGRHQGWMPETEVLFLP